MTYPKYFIAWAALTLWAIPSAVAQDLEQSPPLSVSVSSFDEAGPYYRRFRVTSHRPQEVVVDRRLLRFTVRPEGSRRRHVCTHPDRPRRGLKLTMTPGQSHEEWIDLRMYCTGRALTALRTSNAVIDARYDGRRQALVRLEGERRSPRRVDLEPIAWRAPTERDPSGQPNSTTLTLRPHTGRGAPLFRVVVRSTKHIYIRDDMFRFSVSGPTGEFTCDRPHQPIVPIRDFFRRSYRSSLRAGYFCPDDAFELPGVYEVTPMLHLVYDGSGQGIRALVGEFAGTPELIRVRSRGYRVQRPDELLRAHAEVTE